MQLIITEEDQQEAHVMRKLKGDLMTANNITHDTYCLHAVFYLHIRQPPDEQALHSLANGSSLRLHNRHNDEIFIRTAFELYVLLRNNGYASFTFDPSIHLPPPETDDEPASHGLDEDTP